jgi:hypothetical protein
MTISKLTEFMPSTRTRDVPGTLRYYLSGRRGLFAAAALAFVLGAVFNWGWLVAAGIAPLLLTALPCLAMCALGLCMNKMASRSSPTQPNAMSEHHDCCAGGKSSMHPPAAPDKT